MQHTPRQNTASCLVATDKVILKLSWGSKTTRTIPQWRRRKSSASSLPDSLQDDSNQDAMILGKKKKPKPPTRQI